MKEFSAKLFETNLKVFFHICPLILIFLWLCAFLAHLQKSKNKDFWGATVQYSIVQNQYAFKGLLCCMLYCAVDTDFFYGKKMQAVEDYKMQAVED